MSMTPENRLGIAVEVLADGGRWWPGELEHWRRHAGEWEAWVRYRTGVGELRIGWFVRDHVRRSPGWDEDISESVR